MQTASRFARSNRTLRRAHHLGAALATLALAAAALANAPLQRSSAGNLRQWQGEGPCKLLILGDSLAAHWSAPPPQGWKQSIIAWPGAPASAFAGTAAHEIAHTKAQAVLVLAGSNDARAAALWPWGNATAQGADAIGALARAAQASGARVVVADLVPPGRQGWWRALLIGERQGKAMAAIMAQLALPVGTRRLAAGQLLSGRDGRIILAMRTDHLHYSAAGYSRLAAGLLPLLQDACPDLVKDLANFSGDLPGAPPG